MNVRHALGAIILVLRFAAPAAAGPLEEGETAYQSGNYETALRLVRPLAEQGNARAQFDLGVIYNNGRGVPQDYVLSYMWFNLSAARGEPEAAERRDFVQQSMSPPQVAEAQKLAREWKPATAHRAMPAVKPAKRPPL
jgi:TPR repeat protein